jgi:tetratricopeptide (TPR) repeat protein
MSDQTYRLNSRLATPEKEYLVQTINDLNRGRVLSSVFAEGELIDSQEDPLDGAVSADDVLRKVKDAHEEKRQEIEFLIDTYKDALERGSPEQMVYLGEALYFKNMLGEAKRLFKGATKIKEDMHQAWGLLGMVEFGMGDFEAACSAFGKAVELKPRFADYRNSLGEAFLAIESCKRAVIEFEEAVKINVYYGEAYLNLALAYVLNAVRREDFRLFAKQSEKTDEMLKKAEMIMPESVGQEYLEGKKYLEKGDLERAFEKLVAVREKNRIQKRQRFANSYLKFMLGSNRVNERLLTRRIKNLKEALAVNPHFADLHHELATAYTLLGSFIHRKAVEEYNKALAINPDFARAQRNLKLAENEIKGFDVLLNALMRD